LTFLAEILSKAYALLANPDSYRILVPKLDPAEKERRRKAQEETAARINAGPGPWSEKVSRWTAETGQSETTFLRVLKRWANADSGGGQF
jgi:hypothetical protein